jgi:hypothetical protein
MNTLLKHIFVNFIEQNSHTIVFISRLHDESNDYNSDYFCFSPARRNMYSLSSQWNTKHKTSERTLFNHNACASKCDFYEKNMEKAAMKHVENGEGNTLSSSSSVFKRLQLVFLIGYLLAGGNHTYIIKGFLYIIINKNFYLKTYSCW